MNLFSPKERDAVEDEFYDTPIYEMADDVCHRCMVACQSFALHSSELFYLCFYIIDTIRGGDPSQTARFVDKCYDDHLYYLRHEKQTGASDCDLRVVVTAIIHTSVEWMLESGDQKWMRVARSLEKQIADKHGDGIVAFATSFNDCVQSEREAERRLFMHQYMHGTKLISQQIDDMLDALDKSEAAKSANAPIQVYGDWVAEKHVDHQVGYVATGGIETQLNSK